MFSTTRRPTVTLSDLRKVPVTQPAHGPGKIWQGVQHGQLVDRLMDHARDTLGLTCDRSMSKFWTTKDGGDMAAALCVPAEKSGIAKLGLVPFLGLAASNRQEMVLTAYAGAVEEGTGAALIPGRLKRNKDAKWMYTTSFDFDYVCRVVWKWWFSQMVDVEETYERMTYGPAVSPGRLNNVLMTIGRKKILPWSRVGTADRAFAPMPEPRTHAALLRAVAVPLSMSSPLDQLHNGWRLTTLLNAVLSRKAKV
jgi:hypothetical protein